MPFYRRLPSGLWQATVRLPDGRRRTRTDPLKAVVKRWADDLESGVRRGEWADPQDGRITVAQWHERWSATRDVERATVAKDDSHWRTHVEPRWGDVRLMAVTAWDVEAWLAKMSRAGVGAATRAQSFRLLRHMLGDAARHKVIASNPTETVRAPKIPRHVDRFLSFDEYRHLEDAMPTDRDKALLGLMCLAGLRWSEAAGLHGTRVDMTARQILVVEVQRRDGSVKPRPKSDAGQRVVPIGDRLAGLLTPVLVRGKLFDVDYTNWRRRVWVPAVARAGLAEPRPTPHDCRHSWCSWLASQGVPPHELMAMSGHGSLRALERYMHASPGRLTRASSALAALEA